MSTNSQVLIYLKDSFCYKQSISEFTSMYVGDKASKLLSYVNELVLQNLGAIGTLFSFY